MSIITKHYLAIECDHCGELAEIDDGEVLLLDLDITDRDLDFHQRRSAERDGWSEDGEGKIHCPACPTLTLTDEAKDERARERERTGLTLFDLEGPHS